MIGDTVHDYEVAQAMGTDCILISSGHNSRERLENTGALVLDSPLEITEVLMT
jgi:phosphoglycolate phosphatase